jgi:PAS domain S-box-containing protein
MESDPHPISTPKDSDQQAAYIKELERRLVESQANLHALIAAQIDSVLESGETSPLLLREAQAALQRSKAELEQKVAERTAELTEVSAFLLKANRDLAAREAALRESEGRFRTMADGTPVMIWVTDADGKLEFINRAYTEFFGVTLDQVSSADWQPFLHPDDSAGYVDLFMECLRERRPFHAQARVRRHDGEWRWIESYGQPRFSESGDFLGMAGSSPDISERKKANEALRLSDARLRVALAHAGLIIYSQDRELCYTWIYNPHPYFLSEDLIGKTEADLLSAEDANRLIEIKRRVLETGVGTRQEVPLTIGGDVFFYDLVVEPVTDSNGEVTGILCSTLDITERKRAEEALLESQNYIKRLVSTSYEGIWSVDLNGTTTFVNQRAAEILGYSVEEIRDRNAFEFLMPDDVSAGQQTLERIAAGESGRVEAHARRKDGSEAVLLVSYSPVLDERGEFQGALAMYSDITDRKQAEQALRRTSEQLRDYSEQLEARVRSRTEELSQKNIILEAEVALRQQMQREVYEVKHRLLDRAESQRTELAQELHDGPMQELYGISYQLVNIKGKTEDRELQEDITACREKLEQTINSLRSMAGELRPPVLAPFGLEKAIRSHAEQFAEIHPDLSIILDLMPDKQALPERMRLALFRIYQTALTNVIRHAQASEVVVRFHFDSNSVLLSIQDDGRGFEVPKRWFMFAHLGHLGLAGAAERAEAMGGSLEVQSKLREGTVIKVILPIAEISEG